MPLQKFLKYCLVVVNVILGIFFFRELLFWISHPEIPILDNIFGAFMFFLPILITSILRALFRWKWVWVLYGVFLLVYFWCWYFIYPATLTVFWVGFFEVLFFVFHMFRNKPWYISALVISGAQSLLFVGVILLRYIVLWF